MNLNLRDYTILRFVADHFVVTGPMIGQRFFVNDKDGSARRRRLSELKANKLINRLESEYGVPDGSPPVVTYYPSKAGCLALALETGRMEYRLTRTDPPNRQHLKHFLALTHVRVLAFDSAALQSVVALLQWVNEFDLISRDTAGKKKPEELFKLYTLIRESPERLVCNPDGAFVLQRGTAKKAYYLEVERATNWPKDVADDKAPGYAALAEGKLHRRHFGDDVLDKPAVLVIAPHGGWREQLRAAFARKAGSQLFKFAAMPDLTPATFLLGKVWWTCEGGEPDSLVRAPVESSGPDAEVTGVVTASARGA